MIYCSDVVRASRAMMRRYPTPPDIKRLEREAARLKAQLDEVQNELLNAQGYARAERDLRWALGRAKHEIGKARRSRSRPNRNDPGPSSPNQASATSAPDREVRCASLGPAPTLNVDLGDEDAAAVPSDVWQGEGGGANDGGE